MCTKIMSKHEQKELVQDKLKLYQQVHDSVSEGGGSSTGRMVCRGITRSCAGIISSSERGSFVGQSYIGILIVIRIARYVLTVYPKIVQYCAFRVMGIFKWFKKDIVQEDQNRRNLLPSEHNGLNNEAYRNAVHAFLDRRRSTNGPGCIVPPTSPDMGKVDILVKKNNNNKRENNVIPGVPHVSASEVFEIGWVAGTEDRYLEFIFAEWHNTRVSLKRHTHPDCHDAVRADLEVLTEIRHPNVLLLMGTTQTDDHGLVAIFESVDCTLYNYIHEQGERMSIQESTKYAGKLADALRHAHVRGYVHGALSSHCVYLASGDTVKLGGWELATSVDSPKSNQKYQERLRAEIYKWQAPEIFHGYEPSKESDVYGLSLLIWEMCTMHIPWSGFGVTEVEQQYVHRKRGIITDLYDFPPLLNNLLEAGLQLDVTKRTLDMNRMRRFLQKTEMQYENEDSIYIDHCTNNNQHAKAYKAPVCTTPNNNSPVTAKCKTADILNSSTPKRPPNSEKIAYNQLVQSTSKKDIHPDQINFFINNETKGMKIAEQGNKKYKYIMSETQKCNEEVNALKTDLKVINDLQINEENDNQWKCIGTTHSEQNTRESEKNMDVESNNSETLSVNRETDFTDDKFSNDTLKNVTKLKEYLAAKREKFFYGNDSSQIPISDISPETRHRILSQARSQHYEQHKPADHKTNSQPKQNKSPNQYDPFLIKPASHHNQRSPYSTVPKHIKEAILQRQVLHPDSQSFFESSLWKKEKLICLSKMKKTTRDNSRSPPTMDNRTQRELIESSKNDETFTIEKNTAAEHARDLHKDLTSTMDGKSNETYINSAKINISQSKSIQALKDALDRATDIVHSTTSNIEESRQLSLLNDHSNFDLTSDGTEVHETTFENLHRSKLCNVNPDDEIKTIEKWTTDENDSLFLTKTSEDETSNSHRTNISSLASPNNEMLKNDVEVDNSLIHTRDKSNTVSPIDQDDTISQNEVSEGEQDSFETSLTMMFFKKSRENECRSCHELNAKARRRSLPASLGQYRSPINSPLLGKLRSRKMGVPDNSVEDLYIDDELGANLNVNLVLLDDNLQPDDDDFLSNLSDHVYPRVQT